MHMSELADALFDSKSGITYQVTQLERAGLVERQPCQHHERGVHAVLTEAGRTKLRAAVPAHLTTVRKLLVDNLTLHEQEVLSEVLAKIARQASS
jgi:DNA-binding MarR family transcriptional regulator